MGTSMQRLDFFSKWSALHGGAEIKGIVKAWLSISFFLARALSGLRIGANLLTVLGLLLALGLTYYALNLNYFLALILLALSLLADGVDGSVAIYRAQESRLGAALDSIVDRVSETLWALSFYFIGADYRIVLLGWLIAAIQEYVRARLAGLGISEVGVVTICERPVRASIIAVALVALALDQVFLNGEIARDFFYIHFFAGFWVILQTISLATLLRFAHRTLKS
jgi:archaetidylinositol phosphate synthase